MRWKQGAGAPGSAPQAPSTRRADWITSCRPPVTRRSPKPSGEAGDLDSQARFLVDLAMQSGVQRFAEFDPAAGQRIKSLAGRAGAPHQQHLVVAEDRGTNGELWALWVFNGGHGGSGLSEQDLFGKQLHTSCKRGPRGLVYCLSMIYAQTLSVCRGESRFTLFRIML